MRIALVILVLAGPGCLTAPTPSPDLIPDDSPDILEPSEPAPGTAGLDLETLFLARSEETRRGIPTDGSYLDSHFLDGKVEIIAAELDRGVQKLEHRWSFEELPAGDYELELVAISRTYDELALLEVAYKTGTARGHTSLFEIPDGEPEMSYTGMLSLKEPSPLELRVKLPRETEAVGDLTGSIVVDLLVIRPL